MAAGPAAAGLAIPGMGWAAQSSKIDGVQIGAITYSFRGGAAQGGVPAPDMPATMQKIGLSEVELMSGDCEIIAGLPQNPNAGRGGGGFGGGRGGSGGVAAAADRAGGGGGGGFGRGGGAGEPCEIAMAPQWLCGEHAIRPGFDCQGCGAERNGCTCVAAAEVAVVRQP